MSQQEIVDAVLQLLRNDHRVADVWHSADTIAQLLNISTMALNKALSKSAHFAQIDLQNNNIGIVRFKKQIQKSDNNNTQSEKSHFLYFEHRKTPTFFTDTNTWTEIYRKSAEFKLAPRRVCTIVVVSPTSHETIAFSPPKKRRCHRITTTPFDIFVDKRTKSLFICRSRADFQERINRI
jgi:hypothetical protein